MRTALASLLLCPAALAVMGGCAQRAVPPPPPWRHAAGVAAGQRIVGPDGADMVWVPPGEYPMGSQAWGGDQTPVHRVRMARGFWLARTETTNARYDAFCSATRRQWDDRGRADDRAAVWVSWADAQAYCEHYGLRLPTEAEWEYAGRGPGGRIYPWGNKWDPAACNWDSGRHGVGAMPVGGHPRDTSWCGALDLAGNVREWCEDWYDETYYRQSPPGDPPGPVTGRERVARGGEYCSDDAWCQLTFRYSDDPSDIYGDIGFRCAVSPTGP